MIPEPCPFACGSELAYLVKEPRGDRNGAFYTAHYVQCPCGARGAERLTAAGAFAVWNTRFVEDARPGHPPLCECSQCSKPAGSIRRIEPEDK